MGRRMATVKNQKARDSKVVFIGKALVGGDSMALFLLLLRQPILFMTEDFVTDKRNRDGH